jgi:hypothetical protein
MISAHDVAEPAIPRFPVEEVPPGEANAIVAMIKTLKKQLEKNYLDKKTTALRDAHPKPHGLVTASFIVHPDCPFVLQHGLFKRPDRFEAVIRFSNGHPKVSHDLDGDVRGMAIKLLGGDGSLIGEPDLDFLVATGEAFFGKDAVDFKDFPAASETSLKTMWYFIRGLRLRGAWQLVKGRKRPASPLALQYFSQTPYRLGPHCVKYSARPLRSRSTRHDPWYLRPGFRHLIGGIVTLAGFLKRFLPENAVRRIIGFDVLRGSLARDLARAPFTFEFLVQRWPDLSQLPVWAIENATRRWTAPWVPVATIVIHQQNAIHKRDVEAERMAFTPWRALPEHQPLGGINRARLAIYREMSSFRRGKNEESNTY